MNLKNKKIITYILYTLTVLVVFFVLLLFGQERNFTKFTDKIENSSFDLRQSIISKSKKPNEDIVIVAVDDASYEYILDKGGSWPISRFAWANTVAALEFANPKFIVFDLLFIKPNLYDIQSDNIFAGTVAQYNNVFLSMNFDHYSEDVRKAVNLNEKFRLNVSEGALPDNEHIAFENVRTVMPQLMAVTRNIGSVTVEKDTDGVIRNTIPIYKYKKNYYPNLSLLVAMNCLGVDNVKIKNNTVVLDANHTIPLDKSKKAILNWYPINKDNKETISIYKHIPFWKVVEAITHNDGDFLKENFSDKVIYIGTTATSLSDIKTSPISAYMPGVEFHGVFLNNILDNNFIKKVSGKIDMLIAVILSVLIGYYVLKTSSVVKSFLILMAVLFGYLIVATYAMKLLNIWLSVTMPTIFVIITFILIYMEKYFLKSKDYEQTYKLAVTDGLTQLYNHRYFQEQMILNLDNYKRYGNVFSLILIDIDFFKKFNDTYGHQSGDAVLVQVANILKKNIRVSDIACRYGGEEMSVILSNTNNNDAVITANKICTAVRNHKFEVADGKKVNVTISVGVATVNENISETQQIIEYSDKCLYKAKESGRDQVVSEI